MEKRKSKFEVILDYRDLDILKLIKRKRKITLGEISASLDIVDAARIVHINRLLKGNLISIKPLEYPYKQVLLTKQGKTALKLFG